MIKWYANAQHQANYEKCLAKFPLALEDRQYRSACYIAAYPEIFKCFNLSLQVHGPFDWYFHELDQDSADRQLSGSSAGLTGGTFPLVHLALNLWNGREFDLEAGLVIWDAEQFTLALRAMDLRRKNSTVKLF